MRRLHLPACIAGLALMLAASPARADIRVTLSSSTVSSATYTQPGDFFNYSFQFAGATFSLETTIANFPGTGTQGGLASTLNIMPNANLNDLTVTVEDVDSNGNLTVVQSPTTTNFPSYILTNSASVTTAPGNTLSLTGTAQINNTNLAPVAIAITGSPIGVDTNSTSPFQSNNGYTLSQTYSLTNLSSRPNTLTTVGFNTTISGTMSPGAALPEPSSLVLTGGVALGLGVVGIRRRLQARSA